MFAEQPGGLSGHVDGSLGQVEGTFFGFIPPANTPPTFVLPG
jgi:hypothetical protein